MNKIIDSRIRNTIFLVFLTLTIILILITCLAAANQDRLFLSDYVQYTKASQLIYQDKYAEAEPILAELVKNIMTPIKFCGFTDYAWTETGKPQKGLTT